MKFKITLILSILFPAITYPATQAPLLASDFTKATTDATPDTALHKATTMPTPAPIVKTPVTATPVTATPKAPKVVTPTAKQKINQPKSSITPTLVAKPNVAPIVTLAKSQATSKDVTPLTSVIPATERESKSLAPYTKELQAAKMPANIIAGWQQLYEQCLQANNPSKGLGVANVSVEALAKSESEAGLFSINFFTLMANYLDPKKFPEFTNDPLGKIHFNYATVHLRDAVTRLGSIMSIVAQNGMPTVDSTGDCRDMGIIVNLQNNTKATFSVNQVSLDGKTTTQIGQISPGLNELNLHTAALQTPFVKSAAKTTNNTSSTEYYFQFEETSSNNDWIIYVKLMTGKELRKSLTPISSEKPNVFLLNGHQASAKYIATSNHHYMVLTHQPKITASLSDSKMQAGKRVQALDITKFSGPFLITLQINPVQLEFPNENTQLKPTITIFNQPSISSLQIINPTQASVQNKIQPKFNLPLIVLPEFLWINPTTKMPTALQAYWMITITTYLQILTQNSFLNSKNFGDSFEYCKDLECFDKNKQCKVVIDEFAILKSGQLLYDAPWIIGSNLYESSLNLNKDIPQISSSQSSEDKIIANSQDATTINCILNTTNKQIDLTPSNTSFGNLYQIPHNNIYLFTIPNPKNSKNFKVFAKLQKIDDDIFSFTVRNKDDFVLFQNIFYTNISINSLKIKFITNNKNWTGSSIDLNSINKNSTEMIDEFEIQYQQLKEKFELRLFTFARKDKKIFKHTINFSKEPPIENLYIETYQHRDLLPYTTHFLIKNQALPSFLQNLTNIDWINGISFIPTIKSDPKLKSQNDLIITFYKKNQAIGHLLFKNIQIPITAYNLKSSNFDPAFDVYLSTEILLKYQPKQ